METSRIITSSHFFPPAFVLLTSARPAQVLSLLQHAFVTRRSITDGWYFRASGNAVVLRFTPDRFSRYVTPPFYASLTATVGGSNVFVIKKGALTVLMYYIAFLVLGLLAGRGIIETREHPIASGLWETAFFLSAYLIFVKVELDRVKR